MTEILPPEWEEEVRRSFSTSFQARQAIEFYLAGDDHHQGWS